MLDVFEKIDQQIKFSRYWESNHRRLQVLGLIDARIQMAGWLLGEALNRIEDLKSKDIPEEEKKQISFIVESFNKSI